MVRRASPSPSLAVASAAAPWPRVQRSRGAGQPGRLQLGPERAPLVQARPAGGVVVGAPPSAVVIPRSAEVSSVGTIHSLLDALLAICGSI